MNQRGVADRAILEPLFHYLTEHCPFIDSLSQDDVEDYSQVFVDVHDGLQDEVVQEINKICDQWVESPAGTAFMEAFAKAKFVLFESFKSNILEKITEQSRSLVKMSLLAMSEKTAKKYQELILISPVSPALVLHFFGFMSLRREKRYQILHDFSNFRTFYGRLLRAEMILLKRGIPCITASAPLSFNFVSRCWKFTSPGLEPKLIVPISQGQNTQTFTTMISTNQFRRLSISSRPGLKAHFMQQELTMAFSCHSILPCLSIPFIVGSKLSTPFHFPDLSYLLPQQRATSLERSLQCRPQKTRDANLTVSILCRLQKR